MITSALISFLGGHVFRQLLGELVSFFTKSQDHSQELARMRLQGELDIAQHQRQQEAVAAQATLGVQTVRVQSEAAVSAIEADGWLETVRATGRATGLVWVDGWNAVIRPAVATWAIGMMTLGEFKIITMSENTVAVCGLALGIYLADRSLFKRGK